MSKGLADGPEERSYKAKGLEVPDGEALILVENLGP
jgi:hypothetical protein